MANEELIRSIDDLLSYVESAADVEAASGPTWLADLSASGVSQLRLLRETAASGAFEASPGFDVADLLGQSWVEVHSKVDPFVEAVNQAARRS